MWAALRDVGPWNWGIPLCRGLQPRSDGGRSSQGSDLSLTLFPSLILTPFLTLNPVPGGRM